MNTSWNNIWTWVMPALAASIPLIDFVQDNPLVSSPNVIAAFIVFAKVAHLLTDAKK